MNRHIGLAAAILVALVGLLAGCTPDPEPTVVNGRVTPSLAGHYNPVTGENIEGGR
jgi:hypothetical protein